MARKTSECIPNEGIKDFFQSSKAMDRATKKRKESGAEGRKRRKLQAQEAEKSKSSSRPSLEDLGRVLHPLLWRQLHPPPLH